MFIQVYPGSSRYFEKPRGHIIPHPQVSIIQNLSWLEMSERSLLIGATLASFLQPIALLSLDYILVILHSDGITKNFIDSQMWRDIVPMLTPGSFVRFYFCQPNPNLDPNQHEFRFYGNQDLFLKLPLRSSSKVQSNSLLRQREKVLGGCILSGSLPSWPICLCPLQAVAQQANGSKRKISL